MHEWHADTKQEADVQIELYESQREYERTLKAE